MENKFLGVVQQNTKHAIAFKPMRSNLAKEETPGTPAQLFHPRYNKNLLEKIGYAIEQTCRGTAKK